MRGYTIRSVSLIFGVCIFSGLLLGIAQDQANRGGAANPSNSVGGARFIIMDMGPNLTPVRVSNSGYVVCYDGTNYYRWYNGVPTLLTPANAGETNGVAGLKDDGSILGTESVAYTESSNSIVYNPGTTNGWTISGSNTVIVYTPQVVEWNGTATQAAISTSPVGPGMYTNYPNTPGLSAFITYHPPNAALGYCGESIVSQVTQLDHNQQSPFQAIFFYDTFLDGDEMGEGSIDSFTWPIYTITSDIHDFLCANNNGDLAVRETIGQGKTQANGAGSWSGVTNTPTVTNNFSYSTNYFAPSGGDLSPIDFTPGGISNHSKTLGAYVMIGTKVDSQGNTNNIVSISGQEYTVASLPGGNCGATEEVITTGSGTNVVATTNFAPQFVGGSTLTVMHTTNSAPNFDPPQDLNLMINTNSGWSNFGNGNIDDNGTIYGTAVYAGTNTNIAAGSHGVLLLPAKVSWETVGTNTPIDDNNDPVTAQPMPGGGKRIYPDKQNPTDTGTGRNKVTLRVDTGGTGAGWTVYVKVFDVADPTPDPTQVIHTHGTATGDSVGGDNFTDPASTALTGSFTSHDATVDTAHATLDSSGKHDFEFNVGYQPGNNYRVAVTFFKADDLSSLQVTDSTQPGYVPMDASKTPSGFSGAMSPPLTVWRRLWIEQDSMVAVPTTGPQQNVVSGLGVVSITRDSPVTGESTLGSGQLFGDSANRFEHGTMTINGTPYPVVSNTHNSLVADSVVITGTPSDAAVLGKSYTLVDDDEEYLPSGWSPLMPRSGIVTNDLVSKYSPAYILVVDAAAYNTNPTVPFYLNDESSSDMSASKDLTTAATCWTHLVTAAYQPNQSEDDDPNSELPLFGGTFGSLFGDKSVTAIWLETIRDEDDTNLRNPVTRSLAQADFLKNVISVTAHEAGHAPGNQTEAQDHAEGGIMSEGGGIGETKFTAPSLLRFRKSQTWNGD